MCIHAYHHQSQLSVENLEIPLGTCTTQSNLLYQTIYIYT